LAYNIAHTMMPLKASLGPKTETPHPIS